MPEFDPTKPFENTASETEFDSKKAFEVVSPAESLNIQKQAVPTDVRMVVTNLLDNSPTLQQEYLKKQGYEARVGDTGELEARKSGETEWGRVDPSGWDPEDILDVLGDVVGATLTMAGGMLGAGAGPVGVAGGSAIGAGLAESAKQAIGSVAGVRPDVDLAQVAQNAGVAGLVGGAGSGVGSVLKRVGAVLSRIPGASRILPGSLARQAAAELLTRAPAIPAGVAEPLLERVQRNRSK